LLMNESFVAKQTALTGKTIYEHLCTLVWLIWLPSFCEKCLFYFLVGALLFHFLLCAHAVVEVYVIFLFILTWVAAR
jgi:hypothetical protein